MFTSMSHYSAYLSEFLHPKGRHPPDLGHVLTSHSEGTRSCFAAQFLYYLLAHSRRPEYLANEMLALCSKTVEIRHIVDQIVDRPEDELPSRSLWAEHLHNALPPRQSEDPKSGAIPQLNLFARYYLTHLCIPIWNPWGRIAPQSWQERRAEDPLMDMDVQDLTAILMAGSHDSAAALRALIQIRDRSECTFTGDSFVPPSGLSPETVHILPTCIQRRKRTRLAIETFTGNEINDETIRAHINLPENALLLDYDSYDGHTVRTSWGIEVLYGLDGVTHYFSRVTRRECLPYIHVNNIDKELLFGLGERSDGIGLPHPGFCNLRLDVLRVLDDSGAADVLSDVLVPYEFLFIGYSDLGIPYQLDAFFLTELGMSAEDVGPFWIDDDTDDTAPSVDEIRESWRYSCEEAVEYYRKKALLQ